MKDKRLLLVAHHERLTSTAISAIKAILNWSVVDVVGAWEAAGWSRVVWGWGKVGGAELAAGDDVGAGAGDGRCGLGRLGLKLRLGHGRCKWDAMGWGKLDEA